MSGSAATIASSHAFERATAEGWKVVEPKANELFVDIDNEADFEAFPRLLEIFSEHVATIEDWIRTPSKSGKPGRYHIIVTLTNPVTDRDRLFYQLALGSDRKRGLLWIARVNAGDPVPTLFFEKNS